MGQYFFSKIRPQGNNAGFVKLRHFKIFQSSFNLVTIICSVCLLFLALNPIIYFSLNRFNMFFRPVLICLFALIVAFSPELNAQSQIAKDIIQGPGNGLNTFGTNTAVSNNVVYFTAWNQLSIFDQLAVWKTDGSEAGTVFVSDDHAEGQSGVFKFLQEYNGNQYYNFNRDSPNVDGVWRIETSPDGVTIINPSGVQFSNGSNQGFSAVYNNNLYLTYQNAANGGELWVSNGTAAGSSLLKDINPGSASSRIREFTVFKNELFFIATDATGTGLWKTNGTSNGTVLVQRTSNLTNAFIFPPLSNALVFAAPTNAIGDKGTELWVSDGTSNGTGLLKDINPGINSSSPGPSIKLGNSILFSATNGPNGAELWVTDGSSNGTQLVKDIFPGNTGSQISFMGVMGGQAFFTAHDGVHSSSSFEGNEMWVSNGTAAGTKLLKDIIPGAQSGVRTGERNFAAIGNLAFFSSGTGVEGNKELWVTDGTEAGTQLLVELFPGNTGSDPRDFQVLGNKLIFAATTPDFGRELWTYDLGALSSKETSLLPGVELFPTVTEGPVQLRVEDQNLTEVDVRVFDRAGKLMWSNDEQPIPATLNFGHLPTGTYIMQILDSREKRFASKAFMVGN
jgi:ELWxxDGT repeat protein